MHFGCTNRLIKADTEPVQEMSMDKSPFSEAITRKSNLDDIEKINKD